MSPDTGPLGGPYSLSSAEFPARAPQRLKVSFEFSPPRTEAAERTLWETVTRLAPLQPTFFSVTYGAGGSTRQRTHETVARLKKETGVDAAAHLTCVGATQGEIDDDRAGLLGCRHPPRRGVARRSAVRHGRQVQPPSRRLCQRRRADRRPEEDRPVPDQRRLLSREAPRLADAKADLENLKRKVDAGADRCITQFFFDADDFLRFRDSAAAAGVNAPIVPGIMPVSNFQGITKMAGLCGAKVPAWLANLFDGSRTTSRPGA